ncbi:MAG: carbon storage regulator CsrA [Gorillibacterium sp.]|nr:carbon storage regulator CsrA [Gorillibacterium sp.]
MLVLARKKGESIIIGDDIEIIVLETEGDTVRLGINAPRQVQIYRQEVYQAIKNSNKAAAESKVDISQLFALLKKEEK